MWCMVVLLLLHLSVSLCGCWYTYRWSLFNSDCSAVLFIGAVRAIGHLEVISS